MSDSLPENDDDTGTKDLGATPIESQIPPPLEARSDEQIADMVIRLREAVAKQRDRVFVSPLRGEERSDEYLMRFLFVCKYDIEKALERIKKSEEFEKLHFRGIAVSPKRRRARALHAARFIEFFRTAVRMLPSPTPTIYAKYSAFDYDKWSVEEILDAMYYVMEKVSISHLDEAHAPARHGLHMIADAAHIGWRHFNREAEKTGTQLFKIFPVRIGRCVILNQPFIMSAMLAIMRPFMPRKMKERLYVVGGEHASLHDFYAAEHLPESFGGSLSLDDHEWLRDWIWSECDEVQLRVDIDNTARSDDGGGGHSGGDNRDSNEQSTSSKDATADVSPQPKRLGLSLVQNHWWRVMRVRGDTLGAAAGARENDFLTHVNGAALENVSQIAAAIEEGGELRLTVRRPSRDVFGNVLESA